ncbi:MAG: putative Glycerophosphoryl diester phosphodiesterase [Candidatus Saccharibacteria bacterium]|nr:putative Glycerophosphoryl diester phosphodiesterase [Candidatus Saccharibacteria bacterium]
MKIIGHRGAASLALENTKASLLTALDAEPFGIEFDVRLTKDDRLVLSHDPDMLRVAGKAVRIRDLTCEELKKIPLINDDVLLALEEALDIIGSKTQIVLEFKDDDSAGPLLKVLEKYTGAKIWVASFKLQELALLREANPNLVLYGLERTRPFDIIHFARQLKLNGIGLNYWILNPLTYWLARHDNLDIYVYTVNNRLLIWFIHLLYPQVAICTNFPQWYTPHRQSAKAS